MGAETILVFIMGFAAGYGVALYVEMRRSDRLFADLEDRYEALRLQIEAAMRDARNLGE